MRLLGGGTTHQFERASQVLDSISCNVMHAGGIGTGLCRQGRQQSAEFGVSSGDFRGRVAAGTFRCRTRKGSFDHPENFLAAVTRPRNTLPDNILSGKMNQGFSMGLMQKDANLALAIADHLAVPMPIGRKAFDALGQSLYRTWAAG
ncbi:MAG: hypothetical protein CM1200mP20_13920 [Pseudomonadota bacterium]|nr:MAG: hypothetical protein CM1200mP20_13920 [Pseudomonadota bacterium]